MLIAVVICVFLFGGHSGSIIIASLKDILRTEGFKGMYRGLSPTIVALLPNWAVSTTFLDLFLKINVQILFSFYEIQD